MDVTLNAVLKVTYMGDIKASQKVAYVSCETVGEDYDTPVTLVFPVDECPVTAKGQAFRFQGTCRYQVYPPRDGRKESHNFVVTGKPTVQRVRIKIENEKEPAVPA